MLRPFLHFLKGIFFCILLPTHCLHAQVNTQPPRKLAVYKSRFQVSLFPGISTNGIYSGRYTNIYSLNLFGGLSAGNRLLEVGLISNVNTHGITGIQFAGLANIVGANAFLNLTESERNNLVLNGFESSSKGLQFAGFLNYVRNQASGLQLAGAINATGGSFSGVQLAALGNSAGAAARGIQLAGIYNLSGTSISGFQISGLFNYAGQQLSGIQIGLFNKAGWIHGKRTNPPTPSRGVQIGLINFCRQMDGLQIGLINFGGMSRGTQIGLINFFNKYGSKERTEMGTPIGLLNYGSRGSYIRVSYSELFQANIEYTTGNCQNCTWTQSEMPYEGNNKIVNQNALLFGYNALKEIWGFGYGFQKVLYDKKTMLPASRNPALQNEKRLLRYGIKFIHLNKLWSVGKDFNLVSRLNIDYGRKFKGMYIFVGTSLNHLIADVHSTLDPGIFYRYDIKESAASRYKNSLWLGLESGLQWNIKTKSPW